jgi:RNA-directed DNA polymerase
LKTFISYQDERMQVVDGFPQGSVIGPSLANFTLNGLENLIRSSQVTKVDEEKRKFLLDTTGEKFSSSASKIRKTIASSIIRYADDFVVVCNDLKEITIVQYKIEKFLLKRGLKIKQNKSNLIVWKDGAKFDYLGFTFQNIMVPKASRITEQRKNSVLNIRGGLYVYPSNKSVGSFKNKIKEIFKVNLNLSPYRIICLINPIIRG